MFYIACVLYNKLVESIASMQQFMELAKKYNNVEILILDNTTDNSILNSNARQKNNTIHYICNNGNIGLSKAYNKVLGLTVPEDWIFWADDDTCFSMEYLENIYVTSRCGEQIIAGTVLTNVGTILSPIHRKTDDKSPIEPGTKISDVYCINSGLCIKRSVYNLIGFYDEGLFIDMIDYWLFDEFRKHGINDVFIVQGKIQQAFSGTTKSSLTSKIKRFKLYAKDFNHYCTLENRSWYYRLMILAKRLLNIIVGNIIKGRLYD